MHKLYAKLLFKATRPDGNVDLDALAELVGKAFDETERDLRRVDRSMALMVEEIDGLTRGLEDTVAARTGELHQREAELRSQNELIDAAINNMSQGLVMFDRQGHVVVCNQRYLEIYNLGPDEVKPGCTLVELLSLHAARGSFPGDPYIDAPKLVARFGSGSDVVSDLLRELPDGRAVSVAIRSIPTGGWVTTHEDISERRKTEKKIAHMAHHDALTDLPNRVLLRQWIEESIVHLGRDRTLAVHYIDLDNFKTVNDTLGHPIGDELLVTVANRLRKSIRQNEMVARVGGDEFAVVQTGVANPAEAAVLARRIRETINAPYNLHGHVAIVDASIGIALAPADGTEPNVLMKNADMALYRSKGDGRGTYRFFEPEMDTRMQARRTLELALRRALPNGEFELHYQPVVDLVRNRVTSCEALIRWHHPEQGMISPADFVPVAEEIGLIVPLGEWVIRKAFFDAAQWPKELKVAVNLSPTQLRDPGIVAVITNALAAAGLSPQRLIVEITEAVLMHNTEATLASLHQLRKLGAEIALDDFGTGYSSLSYLRSFPFDKIKIDRCFIKGLDEGDESATIVRAITGLAANLEMATTAEGVETAGQLEHVRGLGCSEMQGYLFSRALPQKELLTLLERSDELLARNAA
jgi:diguanylate cyclase (GGDEF)-like protein